MELNKTVKGSKKSENQTSKINNIETLYKSWEKVIKLFDNYSRIVFQAKYKTKYGQGVKKLTLKQMLQRSPIALAQLKAGTTSRDLLNQIRQIAYSLHPEQEITKKV